MGLLTPNTTSDYESAESAWRAADDFAFQQGYALSKPTPSIFGHGLMLFCHRGCDTIYPDGMDSPDTPFPPDWYFEDPCPFSMSLSSYGSGSKEKWRLSSGRHTPHTHGPRDLLHLCKIRHPNFEQKHLDIIEEEFAQGSCDEYILELVKEHFTQGMDPVLLRDIRSITNTLRFESGGLFTFVKDLDDHLTETGAVHHTRHDERNRPDSKFFMLGSEDESELALGKGFFQLVLINVISHASQSWKLVEINGYTARGTTFPVAVAVTTSADPSFYRWLIKHFFDVRGPKRQPQVVISNINPDVADGFKSDLPDTKIQLCLSHLSKDVLRVVKQLWKGAKGKGAFMKQADLAKEEGIVPRQENQGRAPNDFLMAWKRAVFASSVSEFEGAWEHLQTDFASQTVPDLLTLAREASDQREQISEEYAMKASMESSRHQVRMAIEFFRDIMSSVSEKGRVMAYEQYCLARASLIDPDGEPLKPCTKNLMTQHGIPCAHTMSSMLQVDRTKSPPVVTAQEKLSLELFDAFWRGGKEIYGPPEEWPRPRMPSSQTTDRPADVAQDRANGGLLNQPTPSPTSRSSSVSLGRFTPEPSNQPQPSQTWNKPQPGAQPGSHRLSPIDLTSPPRHAQRREPSTQSPTAISHNQNARQSPASEPALREMVASMLPGLLREFLAQPTAPAQIMNAPTPAPAWSPYGVLYPPGSKRPWPTSEFAAHPSHPTWGPQPLGASGASVPVPAQPNGVISAAFDRDAVRAIVAEELQPYIPPPSPKRPRLAYDQQPQYHRI